MPRLCCLLLAGALLPAGCGVGGNDAPKTVEQPKIGQAQLGAMVLPQEELGELAAGLEPGESGRVGNAEEAEGSADPNDTGKSLRADGRLDGHEAYYAGTILVAKKKGLAMVGTKVELLEDTVYAAQYLHQRADDHLRFQGKQGDGVRLVVKSFSPAPVADEAEGLLGTFSKGKRRLLITEVAFRRGRLVGSAIALRPDKQDVKDEVWALAVKLDKRIQAVLAGEIEVAPPSPETSTSKEKASAAELEQLPSQTLAPEDVGPGVVTEEEGPEKGDNYRGYMRSFRDVDVGGSHFIGLKADTKVFETASDAATYFRFLSPPRSNAGKRDYVAGFASGAGVKLTDVRVRKLPHLARGLSGGLFTYRQSGRTLRATLIASRSGRHVLSILAVSLPGASTPNDLVPVAQRAKKRLDG